MKNKLKTLALLSLIIFQLPIFLSKAYAETNCTPVYGGGQNCVTINEVRVNKQILTPDSSFYTDNLGVNDAKFRPGATTTFKIDVTNTGSNTVSKIEVKDIFPHYVTFSSGEGKYDSSSRTLTYSLENLAPNETRTTTLTGKILDAKDLPGEVDSAVCVYNKATASLDGSAKSQDISRFCIEKGGKVKTVPKTGAEALSLLALIPAGVAGWFLRKKTPNV